MNNVEKAFVYLFYAVIGFVGLWYGYTLLHVPYTGFVLAGFAGTMAFGKVTYNFINNKIGDDKK